MFTDEVFSDLISAFRIGFDVTFSRLLVGFRPKAHFEWFFFLESQSPLVV